MFKSEKLKDAASSTKPPDKIKPTYFFQNNTIFILDNKISN